MLGAGAMAFDQMEAVRAVRPIDRVLVWSRNPVKARIVAEMIGGEHVDDAADAAAQADMISCATPATSPFLSEVELGKAHTSMPSAPTPRRWPSCPRPAGEGLCGGGRPLGGGRRGR